jgi:hypothetical protein
MSTITSSSSSNSEVQSINMLTRPFAWPSSLCELLLRIIRKCGGNAFRIDAYWWMPLLWRLLLLLLLVAKQGINIP